MGIRKKKEIKYVIDLYLENLEIKFFMGKIWGFFLYRSFVLFV